LKDLLHTAHMGQVKTKSKHCRHIKAQKITRPKTIRGFAVVIRVHFGARQTAPRGRSDRHASPYKDHLHPDCQMPEAHSRAPDIIAPPKNGAITVARGPA